MKKEKKISKRILSAALLTILIVYMVPLTVFAKDKLANPTLVNWGKDTKNKEVWGFWERADHADGYIFNVYEDGNLISSGQFDDCVGVGVKWTIWTRDYEGHSYIFGVIATDSTGQYSNSDEVKSDVLDTDWLTEIYGTEKPEYVTVTWDPNGGKTGSKWTGTYEVKKDEVYFDSFEMKTEEWNFSDPDSLTPPDGKKFVGLSINGVEYRNGDVVPQIITRESITFKYLWDDINENEEKKKEETAGTEKEPEKNTNWVDSIMSTISIAANGGNNNYAEISGDFALPYEVMKYLQDNPNVMLLYDLTYQGVEYHLCIPGSQVKADPSIPYYGPAWILQNYFGVSDVPGADGGYTVKTGDTLTRIAAQFNTTVEDLAKKNGIRNFDYIYVGQKIKY